VQEYNTREIRAAARNIDSISAQLQSLKNSNVVRISGKTKSLKGDTADALQRQLESLANEILALKKGLDSCSADLYDFARRLDIADAKAKALVNSK